MFWKYGGKCYGLASFESASYEKYYKFQISSTNLPFQAYVNYCYFQRFFFKFGKGKVLNHPKTYKWDNRGAGLFHSLLSQKDTQEKLDKLRFDLGLSSNTNAIRKTV